MAKTRAQRKAERRRREAKQLQERARERQARAQQEEAEEARERTQMPESGEVAEFEAVVETGADLEEYGEHIREPEAAPPSPAPSRADVGAPEAETVPSRREQKRAERERRRQAKESAERRRPQERAERQRGPVASFFVSVWRELQRVQWPDRDTLIQASAVTLLFVAVAAAYLGALDAVFSRLVGLVI